MEEIERLTTDYRVHRHIYEYMYIMLFFQVQVFSQINSISVSW